MQGLSRFDDNSKRSRPIFSYPRRRQALAAFVTGAVLVAAGWAIVQPGGRGAAAHGPASSAASPYVLYSGGTAPPTIDRSAGAALDPAPERKHKKENASAGLMS